MAQIVDVALVGPELEENLGLRYIAASLEKTGFPCEILPLDSGADVLAVRDAVLARNPAIVGLSLAFQWRAMDFFALAIALREGGYRGLIVGGGHFSAFTWREILSEFEEIDALCQYEAEETMVDIARAVAAGQPLHGVAGLALREPGGVPESVGRQPGGVPVETPLAPSPELGTLPWPDRRGEPVVCLGHNVAALVASRGCYAHCAFCCIAAWHGRTGEGVRFRLRPVEDVADEMVYLNREKRTDIFIFHDDDFFVPAGRHGVLGRLRALADALDARGMGPFVSVVKARPNDVKPEIFRFMRDRLGLNRLFLGVESDAHQGLVTLDRHVRSEQNHAAMTVLDELGLYCCFNLLMFDPDTTLDTLEPNIAFMERYAEVPFNFGRAELYAGTPLLARMQAEGRAVGDWMGWDYRLNDLDIQRAFNLVMRAFYARNFAGDALANRLQGTRFDVEVARRLHADVFDSAWLDEAKAINRGLGLDSAAGLRAVIAQVRSAPESADDTFIEDLSGRLRETERELRRRASALEKAVRSTVGAGCRHHRPRSAETRSAGAHP